MKTLQNSPQDHATILIVESNSLECEKFSQIAFDEKWLLVVCQDGLEAIQWLNDNSTADLLIIEENSSPISGYQIADYIKTELGLALPVIITTGEIPVQQERRMLAYAEAVIKKPFNESSVVFQIRKTLEKAVEVSPEQNDHYSLNYLMDLSGGDKEFISETIQLFSSTINSELQDLKKVLNQKDYHRIREIAHGIKPSFDMLENEKGKGICHLLNSEAKDIEMPYLIDQLNLVFNNINNQLIKDFPELNLR
jgi:CheY-like chemotaxis protein